MSNSISPTTKVRQLQGVVVSNKMTKTLVVKVNRRQQHPKYKKYYTVSKKYHVHAPSGDWQIGDRVAIIAVRPLSKTKRWQVVPKS